MDVSQHYCRVDEEVWSKDTEPSDSDDLAKLRKKIEPWLSALFQSENLSVLIGSGLTNALCNVVGVNAASMESGKFPEDWGDKVEKCAEKTAKKMRRGRPNIEDRIRTATELLQGLKIMEDPLTESVEESINEQLTSFFKSIIITEKEFKAKVTSDPDGDSLNAMGLLVSFILSFASRMATRERLQIFTTNYDRFIEFGCDKAGIRLLDRFVGSINPIFRSSRLDIDMHYNPPGIRGEPRFLEGVVKFTKLHGSLDWVFDQNEIIRVGLPFGADEDHPDIPDNPLETMMIYPNSAKDTETSMYPYADLFRDFSAAICRSNSTLITFGYGYGDDHINRIIKDMLNIPSAHLCIISYSDSNNRIVRFCKDVGNMAKFTVLLGSHFGNLETLVSNYLPKPAIDDITWRKAELLKRRGEEMAEKGTQGQCEL